MAASQDSREQDRERVLVPVRVPLKVKRIEREAPREPFTIPLRWKV